VLDLGVGLNAWPWIWLTIAVVFALIELTVLGGSFVLLPFSISAFVAAILGFYDVSVEIQWIVFVVGGGLLFMVFLKWARKFVGESELQPGVGADRLVGLQGTVTADVTPEDVERRGRVTVLGEVWGAIAVDDDHLKEGTKVRVVAMRGTRLVVVPVPLTTAVEPPVPGEEVT